MEFNKMVMDKKKSEAGDNKVSGADKDEISLLDDF